jgi:hypothetical protein
MNNDNTQMTCKNCKSSIPSDSLFCHVCGQGQTRDHLRIKAMMSDFFSILFSLDNRIFKTLKAIVIPAKLTLAYKRGVINSYINPARLFLITLILHFAIYSTLFDFGSLKKQNDQTLMDIRTKELCHQYEQLTSQIGIEQNDSLKLKLFNRLDCTITDTFPSGDFVFFSNFSIRSIGIEKKDAHTLTLSEIEEKYDFPGWKEKYITLQFIKFTQNPVGGISYIIANLAWGVVLVILLTSLIMKLLYFRKNPYYVELATLHMHNHSFIFILSLLLIYLPAKISGGSGGIPGGFISSMIIISIVYIYLSLKFYFGQGWIKTFIKFIITGIVYLILMFIFLGLVSLSSLFLF